MTQQTELMGFRVGDAVRPSAYAKAHGVFQMAKWSRVGRVLRADWYRVKVEWPGLKCPVWYNEAFLEKAE